ncbi:hypothetical protein [Stakelama saccharophila]|uniref:Uncharacterized protein n=1 Tax=Stakelama saccharophila TaxID=3075605 RepID=A0ABZ0BBV8_9SPHN|nr:hypothetical protein [Stakelama sp. W311]WNO54323.1 hypothetical protein RPR59_03445 [Stakelama sp. W311]
MVAAPIKRPDRFNNPYTLRDKAIRQAKEDVLCALALAVFITGMVRANMSAGSDFYLMFSMLPPVMFGVYTLALRTASVASAQPALGVYVWLSLAFAVITVPLAWTLWQLPVTALGVLIVSVLPGIALMRIEGGAHG